MNKICLNLIYISTPFPNQLCPQPISFLKARYFLTLFILCIYHPQISLSIVEKDRRMQRRHASSSLLLATSVACGGPLLIVTTPTHSLMLIFPGLIELRDENLRCVLIISCNSERKHLKLIWWVIVWSDMLIWWCRWRWFFCWRCMWSWWGGTHLVLDVGEGGSGSGDGNWVWASLFSLSLFVNRFMLIEAMYDLVTCIHKLEWHDHR